MHGLIWSAAAAVAVPFGVEEPKRVEGPTAAPADDPSNDNATASAGDTPAGTAPDPQPEIAAEDGSIEVVGVRSSNTPNTHVGISSERMRETIAVRNTEDSLRYMPSLFVRKRHIGDTQAPVATRTTGVGASARSLIYADGVLLSALIGNNNTFASPKWGMVSPEEIERVDVLYGPYAASYPGNAIGTVVNIKTRMPSELQASATAAGSWHRFSQYATKGTYPAYQLAGTIGNRFGNVGVFLSANHVDSKSQPLAYVTVLRPSGTSASGTPVTGAFPDLNRLAQPIYVIGAGGFEHQKQDNFKVKVGIDITPDLSLIWRTGLFLNNTRGDAETYIANSSGVPVYSGTVNIEGRSISIPASLFSNQVYRTKQRHWMHAATLAQSGENYSFALLGSLFDFAKDDQRIPSVALPAASSGGAGSIVRMGGTGWKTLDLNGSTEALPSHDISAGVHWDRFTLRNRRYSTADWLSGDAGPLVQEARGHTRTIGVFLQDQWAIADNLQLTLGARYEWWRAFGGLNFSATPPLNVAQPARSAEALSPKASVRWVPADKWTLTLSAGRAVRFPTVSELYQAVATGATITVPNPDLRPEKDTSEELAIERQLPEGRIRLSLFHEEIKGALVSQSAPLVPGSTTLFNYVQNIGKTRTNGMELVVEKRNLLPRFDVTGSFTLLDPKVVSNPVLPASEGKLIPQVPRRRATMVLTWRPSDQISLTGAARYSSRLFATIDNSDTVGHTYQGFEGYVVGDVRAVYKVTPKIDLSVGVENVFDKRYFLFHPFPGRTFTAELSWSL